MPPGPTHTTSSVTVPEAWVSAACTPRCSEGSFLLLADITKFRGLYFQDPQGIQPIWLAGLRDLGLDTLVGLSPEAKESMNPMGAEGMVLAVQAGPVGALWALRPPQELLHCFAML